jgi:hypothetical protein
MIHVRSFRMTILAGLLVALPASAAWQPGGNTVATLESVQWNPRVTTDGHGGAFIALEALFGFGPSLQRLDGDGLPANGWSAQAKSTIRDRSLQGITRPLSVLSDGSGGCYVIWVQMCETMAHGCVGEPGRLHVQRFTGNGTRAPGWPVEGRVVSERLAYPRTGFFVATGAGFGVAADGEHGLWVAWFHDQLVAQHIGPDGERLAADVVIADTDQWRSTPQVLTDHRGGAFVFWADGGGEAFPNGQILGQHLSRAGRPLWSGHGLTLSSARYSLTDDAPQATSTRSGDVVVAWTGSRGRSDPDVFALRVTPKGRRAWRSDLSVCGASSAQADLHMVPTTSDGVLLAWLDTRPEAGVFAQRLDARGRVRWTADGLAVCPGPGDRARLAMTSDGHDGAYLAWADLHSPIEMFATRLDANGARPPGWDANGSAITRRPDYTGTNGSAQVDAVDLAATGDGGAMLVWQDRQPHPTAGDVETAWAMLLRQDGPAASPATGGGPRSTLASMPRPEAPGARLALHAALPNPSHGQPSVRLTLADDSPAELEMFDISGRRVLDRSLRDAPGEHTIALSPGQRLAPGIYLLRLSQHTERATMRVVITR